MKKSWRIFVLLTALVCLLPVFVSAQDCNVDMQASTPTENFTDNGDGTVTDKTTGLMWKDAHEVGTFTWQQALQKAQSVNSGGGFAGYTDWRVPNIKELKSIVEHRCYKPSINMAVFPNMPEPESTSNDFWSSSPSANVRQEAWCVNFYSGGDYQRVKSSSKLVRLVRDGQ